MINKIEDYQFVKGADIDADHPHGDLDRIDADLEIMPLRNGNTDSFDADGNPIPRKNIIAGIDPVFLAEATRERYIVTQSYDENESSEYVDSMMPFRRKLGRHFMLEVRDGVSYMFSRRASGTNWLKDDLPSIYFSKDPLYNPVTFLPDCFLSAEDCSSESATFTDLSIEDVSNLFSDIQKLNRYCYYFTEQYPSKISIYNNPQNYETTGTYETSELSVGYDVLDGVKFSIDLIDGNPVVRPISDYRTVLKNLPFQYVSENLKYAKSVKVFLNIVMRDVEPGRIHYHREQMVECSFLVEVEAQMSVHDDKVEFATGFGTMLFDRLLKMAAEECNDGTPLTPFVKRKADEYLALYDILGYAVQYQHKISMYVYSAWYVAELRDRTRWQDSLPA